MVAKLLPLPIACGAGGVQLPVLLPVVRVLLAPLRCALPARLLVVRVGGEFAVAVIEAALSLAVLLATDGLAGMALRGRETRWQ